MFIYHMKHSLSLLQFLLLFPTKQSYSCSILFKTSHSKYLIQSIPFKPLTGRTNNNGIDSSIKFHLPLIVLHLCICFSYHTSLFWLFILSLPFIASDT